MNGPLPCSARPADRHGGQQGPEDRVHRLGILEHLRDIRIQQYGQRSSAHFTGEPVRLRFRVVERVLRLEFLGSIRIRLDDGLSGLGKALEAMAKQGITMKYDTIHMVLGEGNFVLAVSEGSFAGKHVAFYDLFRVANGKIAKHWDTIEGIPARADWKNDNGKF